MPMIKSVIKRFIKGFIAGGIASVALAIDAGFSITSVNDLKQMGWALLVAFVTGGLLSLEKAIRWTPEQ